MKLSKIPIMSIVLILILNLCPTRFYASDTDGCYEWTFNEGTYTDGGQTLSDESGTNTATLKKGKANPTFENGLIYLNNSSFYLLQKPIVLAQDKKWRVEWKGKMESGTKYECQTILGNEGAVQYVMYGANSVFFGNKGNERVEIPCNKDAVAYKDTSYILEGDGQRRVRLTYRVTGEDTKVVSDWYDYPASVGDITVSALFGSYQSILYKGYLDYVRVWEDYSHGVFQKLKVVNSDGSEASDDDISKDLFYLTGTVENLEKTDDANVLCVLALYDKRNHLKNVGVGHISIPARAVYSMTAENGVRIEGVPIKRGMKMKVFLFDDKTIEPLADPYETVFDKDSVNSIKMLSIGNSYSIDASTMVHNIAAADGVNIDILNLHISGCTLEKHWANAQSGEAVYSSQLNGVTVSNAVSIPDALAQEDWDYVSFQQGSHESNDFSKFWTEEKPYLTNMSDYVSERAPNAVQLIHETWSYQNNHAIERLGYMGEEPLARNAMFADVKNAYLLAADKVGTDILPCGEAVYKALNEYGFMEADIYRDESSHLTKDKGRYLVAAVWYSCLSGNSILNNSYKPSSITNDEWQRLKQAAYDAVNMSEYKWR